MTINEFMDALVGIFEFSPEEKVEVIRDLKHLVSRETIKRLSAENEGQTLFDNLKSSDPGAVEMIISNPLVERHYVAALQFVLSDWLTYLGAEATESQKIRARQFVEQFQAPSGMGESDK